MSAFVLPTPLPAPHEFTAEELCDLLDAGVIERYMLSDEQRAQVDAYEAELDALIDAHVAGLL